MAHDIVDLDIRLSLRPLWMNGLLSKAFSISFCFLKNLLYIFFNIYWYIELSSIFYSIYLYLNQFRNLILSVLCFKLTFSDWHILLINRSSSRRHVTNSAQNQQFNHDAGIFRGKQCNH